MSDEKKPEALRAKFTPFPRLPKDPTRPGPRDIDWAKVRQMYVEGAHFPWVSFCKANNLNPNGNQLDSYRKQVDWEEWKKSWIRSHSILQDEEITEELMDVRKLVAVERLKHVKTWTKTAANLHALVQHLMNQHMLDAAWDQKNTLAIQAGTAQKRCKLTIAEANEFASANAKIEALAKASLLVVADQTQAKKLADEALDEESDVIPEFEIIPMGEITNAKERTALLATYFDQFQAKKEQLPEPEVNSASADPS